MRISEREIINAVFLTPLGWAAAGVSGQGICRVVLPKKGKKAVGLALRGSESGAPPIETFEGRLRSESSTFGDKDVLGRTVKLLKQYFSGERVLFDQPLDTLYYTAFQRAVWNAAAGIPYGETRSYGWIARRIGKPKAARAVGQALGANPIPIIIP